MVAHLAEVSADHVPLDLSRRVLAGDRQSDGGWSFGPGVPSDADSTAWAMIALEGWGEESEENRATAVAFLDRHRSPGGYATYAVDSAIRSYIEAGAHSLAGWTAPVADVTAAVLLAVPPAETTRADLQTLLSHQTAAGVIESYWWRSPYYATSLTMRALARHGYRLEDEAAARVGRALDRDRLPDGGYPLGSSREGDAFSTALALECRCRLGDLGLGRTRDETIRTVLRTQNDDGSWRGNLAMRIPAPDVVEPRHVDAWSLQTGGGNSYVADEDGIFATTMSAYALALALRCDEVGYEELVGRLSPLSARKPLDTNVVEVHARQT